MKNEEENRIDLSVRIQNTAMVDWFECSNVHLFVGREVVNRHKVSPSRFMQSCCKKMSFSFGVFVFVCSSWVSV